MITFGDFWAKSSGKQTRYPIIATFQCC